MLRFRLVQKWRALATVTGNAKLQSSRAGAAPKPQGPNTSLVKWKLEHFVNSGQLQRLALEQRLRLAKSAAKARTQAWRSGLSPQKTLLLLRAKYDHVVLQDEAGTAVDLSKVQARDLGFAGAKLVPLLQALQRVKRLTRKPVDERVLMALLGVTPALVRDPYVVTRDVLRLLEADGCPDRALELCRLARAHAGVAANMVLEWCLERRQLDEARRVLAARKKWGVPVTPATYVVYFTGLANYYAWGKVPDAVAAEVEKTVADPRVPCNIGTFNAALRVLTKHYAHHQQRAWALFDTLGELRLRPDAQTFTILLQGCKTYLDLQAAATKADLALLARAKALRLHETHARLAVAANAVWEKVHAAAMPPEPPTKEEVAQDPALLAQYTRLAARPPLDVDRHFVAVFVLCFADNNMFLDPLGPGAHYLYHQRALRFLAAWVPEVRDVLRFTGLSDDVQPAPDTRRFTDAAMARLQVPTKIVEEAVGHYTDANPAVLFPPLPFSRKKTAAIYLGVTRPLVDLQRLPFALVHRLHAENPRRKPDLKREPHAINKFLLRLALDSLVRLGRHSEFYLAVWYLARRWGGLPVDVDSLKDSPEGVLAKVFPKMLRPTSFEDAAEPSKLPSDTSVLDIGLVDDFLFKIDENFPKSKRPAELAAAVVAAFANRRMVPDPSLWARPATFNGLFAILTKNVHVFHQQNREHSSRVNEKLRRHDNTAKQPLLAGQVHQVLNALDLAVRAVFARFHKDHMDSAFVQSYDRLVARLTSLAWTDAPDSHPESTRLHEKIVHTGIFLWRPKSLVDARENLAFSQTTLKSLEFVYNAFKARLDLDKRERDLYASLRSLFQLAERTPEALERLRTLQAKIYRLTSPGFDDAHMATRLLKPTSK